MHFLTRKTAIILASLIVLQGAPCDARRVLPGLFFPGETDVSGLPAGKVPFMDVPGRSLTDTMQAVVEAACLATRVNTPPARPPAPEEDPHHDTLAVPGAFSVLPGLREVPESPSAPGIAPAAAHQYGHRDSRRPRHPPGGASSLCALFLIYVFINGMVSMLARGCPCASADVRGKNPLRQLVDGMPEFSFCGERSAFHG